MASKDTDTIIRAIHEQSKGLYKVVSGGKHKKIIYAKDAPGNRAGQAVRDESGPLILSDTPGEHRNRELAVHRLLKAGVLRFDPWKPPQGKDQRVGETAGRSDGDREDKFEQKIAHRLAVSDEHRRTNQLTQDLRERVEPIVAKLGGWDKRGLKAELSSAAYNFLEQISFEPRWPTKGAANQSCFQLAKGQTLNTPSRNMWSRFFDELESSIDGPTTRYFELVRAAKGLTHGLPPRVLAERTTSDGEVERRVSQAGSNDLGTLKDSPFEFVTLARLHERTGLKWSMGLTIDEYAELQRAYGFMEAVILRDYGDRGAQALATISDFLIKMGEARFYSMAQRDEAIE